MNKICSIEEMKSFVFIRGFIHYLCITIMIGLFYMKFSVSYVPYLFKGGMNIGR